MEPKARTPLIPPRLALFLVAMALTEAARTMTSVQIPIYLRELGANIQQIGLFFTISLVFPLLLRILGGWLSDAIGRLRSLALGSLAGVLAYAAYALAPTWQTAILSPALIAAATALVFPSYKAYIADRTDEALRGRVFGLSETIITISWIVGPPIGGWIAQQSGYRWMFLIAMLTFGLAMLLFLLLARDLARDGSAGQISVSLASLRSSFGEILALSLAGGLVTWILIVDGIRDVAFKMSFDLMPVFLRDIAGMTKQQVGLLDGIFGIALALTSLPAGWLVDKTSERLGVVLGIMLTIASRLTFAFAGGFWGFAFSWTLLGMGGGIMDPAYSSLIARGIPSRLRGIAYGLVATSLGIFSLPAPWIGSQLWGWVGPRAPFILTGLLACLAVLPAWFKLALPKASPHDTKPSLR